MAHCLHTLWKMSKFICQFQLQQTKLPTRLILNQFYPRWTCAFKRKTKLYDYEDFAKLWWIQNLILKLEYSLQNVALNIDLGMLWCVSTGFIPWCSIIHNFRLFTYSLLRVMFLVGLSLEEQVTFTTFLLGFDLAHWKTQVRLLVGPSQNPVKDK